MNVLVKENIEEIKNNTILFKNIIFNQSDNFIIKLLKRLGRLDKDFDREALLILLDNKNDTIRKFAIKNLAKLSDIILLSTFRNFAKNDISTSVRREATSAIGRLRNKEAIPSLIQLTKDNDPKVVLQAIRGLLVFKKEKKVIKELEKFLKHPNEIVSEVVKKEINGTKRKNSKSKFKHTEVSKLLKNTVVQGDVLEILKDIPKESIHFTFTSPPYYNAKDYSIYQSYKQYLEFLRKVFKEVHRITKEGRFFILNTSPIIIPRVSRKYSSKRYPIPYDIHNFLAKMGWEFIDDIVWIKPEASVKNRNAGFLQHRKPLGYKPNAITEMLMVYRKKTDKLIDWNIKQYDETTINKSKVLGDYETTNTWYIDPSFDKIHTAVFPLELCLRVIQYYSFRGDLVFDPFAGRGTLGEAAKKLKRYFFLTEKKPNYVKRIKENLRDKTNLFSSKNKEILFLTTKKFKQKIKKNDPRR